MANEETKELNGIAEVFKALGHPVRLWIAKNLESRELCVCELVDGTGEEFSSVSQHLNVLKKAHVVECEKRGKHVYYRLVYPCIPWIVSFMEARNAVNQASPAEKMECMEIQRRKLIAHLENQKI